MKKLSLYIHIPFCAGKCSYCNFVSYVGKDYYMYDYTTALTTEISKYAKKLSKTHVISSIYIGGGTPSYLNSGLILKIMNHVRDKFKVLNNAEISIEANPNSLSLEKLEEYKAAGINRISIGAQTCNNRLLKSIDRLHDFSTFKFALEMCHNKGFDNISVDMLIGLPKQTIHDVLKMAKFLVKNDVKHISAYSLILERGTKLFNKVSEGKATLPTEDKTVEMYNSLKKYLYKKGFNRYEVSNFALPDYECQHNTTYWTMGEYLGVGLAAHSYIDGTRFANTSNIDEYVSNLELNKGVVTEKEKLTIAEKKDEYIMLSLRTSKGLNIDTFNRLFSCNLLIDKQKEVQFLVSNHFIVIERGFLRLSENAFYVLNSVVQKLID